MQASGYGPVVPDVANAKIELTTAGKIRVYCGVVDMGQGNAGTNLQIAGSILGQDSGNYGAGSAGYRSDPSIGFRFR